MIRSASCLSSFLLPQRHNCNYKSTQLFSPQLILWLWVCVCLRLRSCHILASGTTETPRAVKRIRTRGESPGENHGNKNKLKNEAWNKEIYQQRSAKAESRKPDAAEMHSVMGRGAGFGGFLRRRLRLRGRGTQAKLSGEHNLISQVVLSLLRVLSFLLIKRIFIVLATTRIQTSLPHSPFEIRVLCQPLPMPSLTGSAFYAVPDKEKKQNPTKTDATENDWLRNTPKNFKFNLKCIEPLRFGSEWMVRGVDDEPRRNASDCSRQSVNGCLTC